MPMGNAKQKWIGKKHYCEWEMGRQMTKRSGRGAGDKGDTGGGTGEHGDCKGAVGEGCEFE